jgi:hypothetical protein
MKKTDPKTYHEIMKDIQVNGSGRISPESMRVAVAKLKKIVTKTKQLRKTEGLVFLDREEFAGHMFTTRLWKQARSFAFFDQEMKKKKSGQTTYSWTKHPRSKQWTIGIEKAREVNKDDIIGLSKSIEGNKADSKKSLKKLGISGSAGLNLSCKGAGLKMLGGGGGADESDSDDSDGSESDSGSGSGSGSDSDDEDDDSDSGSGSDEESSSPSEAPPPTKKAKKDPQVGGDKHIRVRCCPCNKL